MDSELLDLSVQENAVISNSDWRRKIRFLTEQYGRVIVPISRALMVAVIGFSTACAEAAPTIPYSSSLPQSLPSSQAPDLMEDMHCIVVEPHDLKESTFSDALPALVGVNGGVIFPLSLEEANKAKEVIPIVCSADELARLRKQNPRLVQTTAMAKIRELMPKLVTK